MKPKKAPEPEPVEEWDGAGFRPAPKPTAPKNLARFLKRTAEVAGGVAPAPEEEPDQRAPGDPPMLRHRVDAKTTGSAADSANDMINAASSNAKDALTKTAEQNRIRAGQMPEEKPRFDVDAFVYFLKTQVVPLVLGFSVVLVMAIGVYRYTAGGDLPMPHLGHVQGTIKIDGKPAKDVHIQFIPISTTAKSTKGKEIKVRASTGISDENGHYELFYIDNFRGAALGKHTVEITYSDQEGRPMFAPEYGPGNSQSKDVSTGENPPFDFAWNSPARP